MNSVKPIMPSNVVVLDECRKPKDNYRPEPSPILSVRQKLNPAVTGICPHCWINLYGDPPTPTTTALPCELRGCPKPGTEEKSYDPAVEVAKIAKLVEAVSKM